MRVGRGNMISRIDIGNLGNSREGSGRTKSGKGSVRCSVVIIVLKGKYLHGI